MDDTTGKCGECGNRMVSKWCVHSQRHPDKCCACFDRGAKQDGPLKAENDRAIRRDYETR